MIQIVFLHDSFCFWTLMTISCIGHVQHLVAMHENNGEKSEKRNNLSLEIDRYVSLAGQCSICTRSHLLSRQVLNQRFLKKPPLWKRNCARRRARTVVE